MREQRKVVTVVFADVVGSTSFASENDPEVVRSRMSRYLRRITEIAGAYGGTVEKFAGDAAMVVFGVPTVHDDDAERAVRTALEIRDGTSDFAVRVGVNTGEAVAAATEDRQFMVSGDAVNVAARLQQGAEPGEVLVGSVTHHLTRNVIGYAEHGPVSARGKSESLVAFKALRPLSAVPVQARGVAGLHADLVGRSRELRLIVDLFTRTAEDRRPHLFTLIGSAGAGKSRLVAEALSSLSANGARVLRGRCLPYGRGVTYWPLIEMVQQDCGITLSDERVAALGKLDLKLREAMPADHDRPAARARLSVMLGLETPEVVMPDTPADRIASEIGWGMRRYVEALAQESPLVLVVDDLQWADPQIVTTLEQLPERLGDSAVLTICSARPEFLEAHREWSSGQSNSTTLTLDPLSAVETSTLISRLLEVEALPEELRALIIERSAGTPLFCEEFLQMLIDGGHLVHEGAGWHARGPVPTIEVPQGINAVLAARLDGLPDVEKRTLQSASVVGERFELGQLRNLESGGDVANAIESLRRKGLVAFANGSGGGLKFRHLLIRDAAYASMPKSQRAELHDRFGSVLERETGDPQALAEILAHHAERSLALSLEVSLDAEAIAPRALRALTWSLAMGERARQRSDIPTAEAAVQTARTASAALPDGGGLELRARTKLLEGQALLMKADYAGARNATVEAAALADQAKLVKVVAKARLTEAWISNWSDRGRLDAFRLAAARAVEACRLAGDVADEIEARALATNELYTVGRLDEFVTVNTELLDRARSIGDPARMASILEWLVIVSQMTGNGKAVAIAMSEAQALADSHGFRTIAANLTRMRGVGLMLAGDLDGAMRLIAQSAAVFEEAGDIQGQVAAHRFLAYAQLYGGHNDEAAVSLDRALALSESSGEMWNRAELLSLRARAALNVDDIASAERLIDRARKEVRDEDITGTSEVNNHYAAILLKRGMDAEAELFMRRAHEVVASSDYMWARTIAGLDLARFLAAHGRHEEAASLLDEYEVISRERSWHRWDVQTAEIRGLLEANPAGT